MKKGFLIITFAFSLLFFSCGNDGEENDSVIDEPEQVVNNHPSGVVGTWIYYSGTPKSILSNVESDNIKNHVLAFTPNGNFSESITTMLNDYQGKVSTANGNWTAINKTLSFTDWNGNSVNANASFSLSQDSALYLTFNGGSATYYKASAIQSMYSELVIGSWEVYPTSGHKGKIVINKDGTGGVYSNYYNGFYCGHEPTTWKVENDSLFINYTSWAYPTSLHKYKIIYLNTKHLSLASKNGEAYYSKE